MKSKTKTDVLSVDEAAFSSVIDELKTAASQIKIKEVEGGRNANLPGYIQCQYIYDDIVKLVKIYRKLLLRDIKDIDDITKKLFEDYETK